MHEVGKNMLKNGCFLFGTSDFAIFCYGTRNKGNLFLNPLAHIKNGKLWIPDGNLFSDMFHYQPGREYTAVVRMRKVGADTPAIATMFFCPENYKKIPMKRVKLTEEFQNYTLQGKLSPSLHNLFWFRIDGPAGKGFFEIERVQLVEGKQIHFCHSQIWKWEVPVREFLISILKMQSVNFVSSKTAFQNQGQFS